MLSSNMSKYVYLGTQFDHKQNNKKISHGVTRGNQ